MSENNFQNFKEEINDINKRLNTLVQYVDTKKNFYNNVFFPGKDQTIPLNLYNIHYNSSQKDYNLNDNEVPLKQYSFDQPDKIFLLPSSDESGNEGKNIYIPSFKKICDDIIDLEYLQLLNDRKDLPKDIYPIVLFRGKDPLTNSNKVLSFVKTYIQKEPYEIKILQIPSMNENKDMLSVFVKFYNYEEAKTITECLNKSYNISGKLCYDKRELTDSKWYCVVFRMEGGGDQKLSKFVQLMDEIYKSIPVPDDNGDNKKKFLFNSVKGSCEGQINGNKCIRKLGEVFYSMIRVNSMEQAVTLCVKYNNTNDLKVNLHYLTYKMKKSEMPQILIDKEENGNNRPSNHKLKKRYKEDTIYFNEISKQIFPDMLSRKHKRNKAKKAKNDI